MKKSFKKAGAAVLSMAMLLSMGAISMPVYAELETHGNNVPTQVAVTIANSQKVNNGGNSKGTGEPRKTDGGVQDDNTHKYYYLDDVNEATVAMYRIATLKDGVGWDWETGIKSAVEDANSGVESKFAKLLEKVDPDVLTSDPKMSSDDLQALAGLIQSTILSNPTSFTKIAEQDIHKLSNGTFETIYLPADNELLSGTANTSTKNVVGYYILITTAKDNAGYVMQPVLVPISNQRTNDENQRYVKKLSLKGTEVSVDKDIIDIATYTGDNDKVAESFAEKEAATTIYESKDAKNIDSTGDLGVVDADDLIKYQIMADIPVYSKNAITHHYDIIDTPDAGINVVSGDEAGKYREGVKNTTAESPTSNPQIKVYYSVDTTFSVAEDTLLDEWTDYTVSVNNDPGKGKGFKINFSAAQLRGRGKADLSDSSDDTTSAKLNGKTMEGGHVFVIFNAVTDKSFNSDWQANQELQEYKTETDVTTVNATDQADYVKNSLEAGALDTIAGYVTDENLAKYSSVALADLYTALGATDPASPTAQEKKQAKAALYLALSELNRVVDEANEDIKAQNANKNGTKNVATVKFDNDFAGKSADADYDEVKDTTRLFSAKLDLKKKGLELLVNEKKQKVYKYLDAAGSEVTQVNGDAGSYAVASENIPNDAVKTTGDKYVYFKAVGTPTKNAASTWETTTDIEEAVYTKDIGGSPTKCVKYVTKWDESDTAVTKDVDGTTPVYIKSGTGEYAGTTAQNEAKYTEGSYNPKQYEDGYSHDKAVKGAVFKLEETFEQVASTSTREAGNVGDHLRSYAITIADGSMKQLKVLATGQAKPADTDVKDVSVATATDIVYYEAEVDTNGEPTGKYTTYAITTDDAWDRIGEGTYKLTEVQAPAGYKKWSNPATLTITVPLSGTTAEEQQNVGKFTAQSNSSNAFWSVDDGKPSSATVTAKFETTSGVDGDGKLTNDILDEPDDTLPATGGIGTVLFTAGGISIVLIAGALFVMYMKKRNAEDEE